MRISDWSSDVCSSDLQLVAECLARGPQARIAAGAGILGENRRAGEAEQMIALEGAGDLRVHVAELAAVAFVEDHHDMRVIDRVLLVTGDEAGKLDRKSTRLNYSH